MFDLTEIMMEALDDDRRYFSSEDIAGEIKTLKRKQKDGEIEQEDYKRLKRALDRIREE